MWIFHADKLSINFRRIFIEFPFIANTTFFTVNIIYCCTTKLYVSTFFFKVKLLNSFYSFIYLECLDKIDT